MPVKRCNVPTCREYIDWTERYCTKHQGCADKQLDTTNRMKRITNTIKAENGNHFEKQCYVRVITDVLCVPQKDA